MIFRLGYQCQMPYVIEGLTEGSNATETDIAFDYDCDAVDSNDGLSHYYSC